MNHKKSDAASEKAKILNAETRTVIDNAKKKNNRAVFVLAICYAILVAVGIAGIYQQNRIAQQNKQHIDCIVKLLATPLPANQQHKVIDYLGGECHITFTQ